LYSLSLSVECDEEHDLDTIVHNLRMIEDFGGQDFDAQSRRLQRCQAADGRGARCRILPMGELRGTRPIDTLLVFHGRS
jgi:hypothetical protein